MTNRYMPGDPPFKHKGAVDVEAAAVWERLTARERSSLISIVGSGADSIRPLVKLRMPSGVRQLRRERCLGVARGVEIFVWPTDLGRRVAAHGKAVRK